LNGTAATRLAAFLSNSVANAQHDHSGERSKSRPISLFSYHQTNAELTSLNISPSPQFFFSHHVPYRVMSIIPFLVTLFIRCK
jgi:hypothetical protein